MGPARVFASTSGRVLTVLTAVGSLVLLFETIASGGADELLRFGAIPVLALVVVWALCWYPQVEVSDGEIVLRNVLRTVRIPWPTFQGADTRWALTVETFDGSFTAWAAPARSGLAARADAAIPHHGRPAGARRRRGDRSAPTADGVALEIAARHGSLEAAGYLHPGPPPAGVRVTATWHWPAIAAATALAALAAIGAVQG